MNKIVVKSLVGQNGESLGAYVDYGDFCKMQSEYEEQIEKLKERIKEVENDSNNCELWSYMKIKPLEEQIEKMKCCENCNKYRKAKCTEDNMFYARTTRQCKDWELAE